VIPAYHLYTLYDIYLRNLISAMQNSSASVDMRSFSFRFLRGRIHSTTVIPLLCCTLVFLKGFGSDVLVGSAINRLIERTICRRYYQSHDHYVSLEEIDEKLCKLDPIQTELSLILGTAGFLSPLVGVLTHLFPSSHPCLPNQITKINTGTCYGGS
jgi:hypothetical protein